MLRYQAGESQSLESAIEGAMSLAQNDGNAVQLERRGWVLTIQPGEQKDEVKQRWREESKKLPAITDAEKEAKLIQSALDKRDEEQEEWITERKEETRQDEG